MAHVKVPLMGSTNRGVFVDPDATPGAVLGVNLFNPDGSLVDPSAWMVPAGDDAGTSGGAAGDGLATTDDLTEGRYNLYYTNARADARIAAHDTFPFFLADSTPAYIPLASDLTLPFFDSTGGANNIALAA